MAAVNADSSVLCGLSARGVGSEHPKCNWHVALDHLQGLGVRRSQSNQFGSPSARNSDDGSVKRPKQERGSCQANAPGQNENQPMELILFHAMKSTSKH